MLIKTAALGEFLAAWRSQTPEEVYRVLVEAGAFRPTDGFGLLLKVIEAVADVDLENLRSSVARMNTIEGRDFADQGLRGAEIGQRLTAARVALLQEPVD
jgi:hypothetical protein